MEYDKASIETFEKKTLEDYNDSLIIENICKVSLVDKTDGSFIQIGIRPLIDEDIFLPNSNIYPVLPSAGRMVAVGEQDFLINNILSNPKIEKVELKEAIEFTNHIDSNDSIIIVSTKFFVEIFTKLMNRIDYERKYPRLDKRYRIDSVPERVLGNRILIIDKDAILWEKEKFYNEFTKKDERIDIKIRPHSDGKVDITIRSVNKIMDIDSELIKVLEVKN